MTHTMKTFTAYTNHPEGGLQDVLDIKLKPGFVLISVEDLHKLKMGSGQREVRDTLDICEDALRDVHGKPRNTKAAVALRRIERLCGLVETYYNHNTGELE